MITTIVSRHSAIPPPSGIPKYLSAQAEESHSEMVNRKADARRILIIDDEAPIADSLAEIFNASGYEALAFYAGQAAIDSARKQCPSIVLSDVVMPKLNGIDTVIAIREICPEARILLFSGQAGTANLLERARASGHEFEWLSKPLHPEELLKRLST